MSMGLLAAIHLAWLFLAPAGLALLVFGLLRKKRFHKTLGVAALIVSLPALYACTVFWPLDFLLPARETRLPLTHGNYEVTLVNLPDSDFYTTGFEVRRNDGSIARVLIDGDGDKWWNPRTVTTNGRTYFVHGSRPPGGRTPYIDHGDASLVPGYSIGEGQPYKVRIADLEFSPPARFVPLTTVMVKQ